MPSRGGTSSKPFQKKKKKIPKFLTEPSLHEMGFFLLVFFLKALSGNSKDPNPFQVGEKKKEVAAPILGEQNWDRAAIQQRRSCSFRDVEEHRNSPAT